MWEGFSEGVGRWTRTGSNPRRSELRDGMTVRGPRKLERYSPKNKI